MAQRYISQGIAEDIESGASVAIIVPAYGTAQSLIAQVTEYTDPDYVQVRPGEGRINHESGGTARFVHSYNDLRGLRIDTLLIPHGMSPEHRSVIPFVAEVIYY